MADTKPNPRTELSDKANLALNKVCRWRSLIAGKMLGTRPDTDPQTQVMRDISDKLILLRVETSALVNLLIRKHVFEFDEWVHQLRVEAAELDKMYEAQYPGFKTTDYGLEMDVAKAAKTTAGWPP